MRYVSSISPPLVTEIGGRKIVRAVGRSNALKRTHAREQPVDMEQHPEPAPYPEERRMVQRRITNESVLMDRRSGLERRRYNLFHHIDEEA